MSRSLSARQSVSRRPAVLEPVVVNRHCFAREVACEICDVAYGAVLAPTGRQEVVEYREGEDGERHISRQPGATESWEMNDRNDPRGFLERRLIRQARQDGWRDRQVQKAVRQRCGELAPPPLAR